MQTVKLTQKTKLAIGSVELPGSKSISNRALIIAELSGQDTSIERLSEADDTRLLKRHLEFIRFWGASEIPAILDVENAGTVARFLTAFLVSHVGEWLITGSQRMKERPIGALVEGLVSLGARIRYCGKNGFLPIHITGTEIYGGEIRVDTSMSSQFVTAILLIGPYLEEGLKINFSKQVVSQPYIGMTVDMMKAFGAYVSLFDDCVVVDPHPYNTIKYEVESDWTSAAYWYEVAALSEKADIFIPGLYEHSIQGDRVLAEMYASLGVKTLYETNGLRLLSMEMATKKCSFDFKDCPDLALPVITTCAVLGTKAVFTGISHLKYKESNRMESLGIELEKIGVHLHQKEDTCSLSFAEKSNPDHLVFNTYHDHRLAMSFAPLVLKYPTIQIKDAEVVAKSYPGFWTEINKLGFAVFTETKTV